MTTQIGNMPWQGFAIVAVCSVLFVHTASAAEA